MRGTTAVTGTILLADLIDVDAWREVFVSSLSKLGTTLAGFLPNLVGMLVILAVGWALSRLAGGIVSRVLARLGLDRSADRLGLSTTLRNAGLDLSPSGIVGALVFWILMLTFVLSAVETLGLQAVTATIDRLIGYLPNVIAAAFIVMIGLLLAHFVRNLVSSGAATANIAYARELGAGAHAVMVILVGVLTVQELGVDTRLLLALISALVGAIAVGMSLAFALGARDVVKAILASHYVRQSFAEGDSIEVGGRRGRIERIGPVDTLLRDGETSWSIPNARLIQEIVGR